MQRCKVTNKRGNEELSRTINAYTQASLFTASNGLFSPLLLFSTTPLGLMAQMKGKSHIAAAAAAFKMFSLPLVMVGWENCGTRNRAMK